MALLSTIDVLTLLQAKLVTLTWTDDSPLFDKVELYSSTDLLRALEELRVFKARACFLVASDDEFSNDVSGRSMKTFVTRHLILLMTDRDYGRRQDAATGDADHPGVIRMKDRVVEALAGQNLGQRQLLVKPTGGNALILTDAQRNAAGGREAWNLELAVESGDFLTQH